MQITVAAQATTEIILSIIISKPPVKLINQFPDCQSRETTACKGISYYLMILFFLPSVYAFALHMLQYPSF